MGQGSARDNVKSVEAIRDEPPIIQKENVVMCRSKIQLILPLLAILALPASKVAADTCPDGAVSTGVGLVLTPFRTNVVTHSLQALVFRGVGHVEAVLWQ